MRLMANLWQGMTCLQAWSKWAKSSAVSDFGVDAGRVLVDGALVCDGTTTVPPAATIPAVRVASTSPVAGLVTSNFSPSKGGRLSSGG